MKKRVLFWLLLLCASIGWQRAAADTASTMVAVGENTVVSLTDIVVKGLPVVYVQTIDNEEPTCEYVSHPAGCMGKSIRNATKVPGRLVIYQRLDNMDSVLYDSGDYDKDVSGMTIKLRGNTSAYEDKKPYKIKLQKKFDLLFRGDDATYKDKEWLLLRDDYLTTIAGLKVNELVGMVWTPRHHFVNLVINDVYRGTYLLCEAIKRNPDCRLNVDKNSGFIFECDPYWWNEDVYVTSSYAPSYTSTFKYPDTDDLLPEQKAYLQSLVTRYERSVSNGTYHELIDVASFARWCLVHDITGTKDAGGTNRFYTKYDTTEATPIVMPVAWDFDMAERTSTSWSRSHTSHMTAFFNSSNRRFVAEFVAAWVKIRDSFESNITGYMSAFRNSAEGQALQASMDLNSLVYNNSLSVGNNVAYRNYWFSSHQEWLDDAIMALNPLGDTNIDGLVDVSDVSLLINMVLGRDADYVPWSADVNGDGLTDVSDVAALINEILNK